MRKIELLAKFFDSTNSLENKQNYFLSLNPPSALEGAGLKHALSHKILIILPSEEVLEIAPRSNLCYPGFHLWLSLNKEDNRKEITEWLLQEIQC